MLHGLRLAFSNFQCFPQFPQGVLTQMVLSIPAIQQTLDRFCSVRCVRTRCRPFSSSLWCLYLRPLLQFAVRHRHRLDTPGRSGVVSFFDQKDPCQLVQ